MFKECNDESRCGPRFQPIRFHESDNRFLQSRQPKPPSGYTNPVDDPEFLAKHWPNTPSGIDDPEWQKKWREQ